LKQILTENAPAFHLSDADPKPSMSVEDDGFGTMSMADGHLPDTKKSLGLFSEMVADSQLVS
jgi:hypothetical protein